MTDIRYFTSPASAVKKDPNDYRNDPDYRNQVESIIKAGRKPNLAWCSIFTITEAEASMYEDPEWAFENLIVRGHVVVIPAPPNGGKTTILMYIAKQIAPDYQVFYVNADISSGDVKRMRRFAAEAGFTLLLPDMKAGKSMADVVDQLIEMNRVDADYSRIVFIFDTLKKMTDVINKKLSKELYTILRGLSAKGMT